MKTMAAECVASSSCTKTTGSDALKPVALEPERSAVLCNGANNELRHPIRNLGFDLQCDANARSSESNKVRNDLVCDLVSCPEVDVVCKFDTLGLWDVAIWQIPCLLCKESLKLLEELLLCIEIAQAEHGMVLVEQKLHARKLVASDPPSIFVREQRRHPLGEGSVPPFQLLEQCHGFRGSVLEPANGRPSCPGRRRRAP
jgi:hypothetical protein